MSSFTAELIGTALLILLGNGVVGGVVLRGSKSENGGWIVITFGWALAVTMAIYLAGKSSGAHQKLAADIRDHKRKNHPDQRTISLTKEIIDNANPAEGVKSSPLLVEMM